MKPCIAQIGTFDVENFGDILFPDIFKFFMADTYRIDLFSPNGGIKPFTKSEKVYPISDLEKYCRKKHYQAIIIGGGDLIRADSNIAHDYEHSIAPALSLWAEPIAMAQRLGIPVLFNCPGVPFRFYQNEKKYVNLLLSLCSYVSVRDDTSKKLIEECGFHNLITTPDTIFSVNKYAPVHGLEGLFDRIKSKNPIFKHQKYLIVQHYSTLSEDDAKKLKLELEKISQNTDYQIILFPIGYVHDDIKALEKIKSKDFLLCKDKYSPLEMLAILSHSAGYIGTSMHGGIVSWAYEKPIIMLDIGGGGTKINGFQKHIGHGISSLTHYDGLYEKFTDVFVDGKISFSEKNNIDKKVQKHFDTIKNAISSANPCFCSADNLVSAISQDIPNSTQHFHAEITVYFDYGSGLSADNRQIIPISNWPNINQEVKIPDGVKNIVLQITDAPCLLVKKFIIEGLPDNKYTIPERVPTGKNGSFYVFNGLGVSINHAVGKIRLVGELEVPEIAEFKNAIQELMLSHNRLNSRISAIEGSRKYKLVNKILKISHATD